MNDFRSPPLLCAVALTIPATTDSRRQHLQSHTNRGTEMHRKKDLTSVICSACFGVTAVAVLLCNVGQLAAGTIKLIDVPGATFTSPWGISGNNVVGTYRDSSRHYHGFLFNGSTYVTIDPPGSTFTEVTGISGNNVVGTYSVDQTRYGFLFDGATYRNIAPPGASSSSATAVSGNNIVGIYPGTGNVRSQGFFFDGLTYTVISPPNTYDAQITGVSGKNVVGRFIDNFVGFGRSYFFDGSTYTQFGHVDHDVATNNKELINGVSGKNVVGTYTDPQRNINGGFLWNADRDEYRGMFPPGAQSSTADAVSGNNVAGLYVDRLANKTHGYFFDGITYTTIDVPGATSLAVTSVSGINVVGSYLDASGQTYGFMYAPEPSTLVLAALGTLGLLVAARRKR